MGPLKSGLWSTKVWLRTVIPDNLWHLLSKPVQPWRRNQYSEVDIGETVYGLESEYMVIRRRPPGAGLLSNVNHVMQGIERSRELGIIPVVDMNRYPTIYTQSRGVLGKTNSWEYFFQPLSRMSLNEVYSSKKYILSAGDRILPNHWLSDKSQTFILSAEKLEYAKKIVDDWIFLNAWTDLLKKKIKEAVQWRPEETLGVFLRHDHLTLQPANHPRQPSIETLIEAIKEKLQENTFRYLFIATENREFREYLHTRIKLTPVKDFVDLTVLKKLANLDREPDSSIQSPILKLGGYLIQTYLFSEVKSCVSGIANGSTFSFILNGRRYENPKVFDLGVY